MKEIHKERTLRDEFGKLRKHLRHKDDGTKMKRNLSGTQFNQKDFRDPIPASGAIGQT